MMRPVEAFLVALALAALLAASGCGARSEAQAAAGEATSKECCRPAEETKSSAETPRVRAQIPDVELVDQDGKRHRFYSDLVKGRIVLMNSIFTKCTGSCPVQTNVFAGVQHRLRARKDPEVRLISISLDPVTDTPARLKEFADRYRAQDGWYFLTGQPEDVREVLEAMDLYSERPQDHTPICVAGNEPAGVWMKVINLASPYDILKRLDTVMHLDGPPVAKKS